MKNIHIGSGAGFGDDRLEPAIQLIEHADLDYIVFECLAERTIALAQKQKNEDPSLGYNDLLVYRFKQILPAIKKHPTTVITNMGAANPIAASKKVAEMAKNFGLEKLKIATVIGDDVSSSLPKYQSEKVMENDLPLYELDHPIISASAYIGAASLVEALQNGADIIICGRVADPALFLAPMIYEFGWSFNDYDKLGKGTLIGHLLECAGQVCGGYFADPGYKNVDDLAELGFPYVIVGDDGVPLLKKLPHTGGLLSQETVKEQLLYEIQDPHHYFTPDVIADFSQAAVIAKDDGIQVTGITGFERSHKLKVSVAYDDGYLIEGGISYGGHNATARANLAVKVINKRIKIVGIPVEAQQIDFIGENSLYHNSVPDQNSHEVRLRFAARTESKNSINALKREIKSLYTNGPAGGGGVRTNIERIVAIASVLIPESEVKTQVIYQEV